MFYNIIHFYELNQLKFPVDNDTVRRLKNDEWDDNWTMTRGESIVSYC